MLALIQYCSLLALSKSSRIGWHSFGIWVWCCRTWQWEWYGRFWILISIEIFQIITETRDDKHEFARFRTLTKNIDENGTQLITFSVALYSCGCLCFQIRMESSVYRRRILDDHLIHLNRVDCCRLRHCHCRERPPHFLAFVRCDYRVWHPVCWGILLSKC